MKRSPFATIAGLLLALSLDLTTGKAVADTISFPGSISTTVTATNAEGDVTGVFRDATFFDIDQGFLFDGTTYTLIDVPAGQFFGAPSRTHPNGINDLDQVVGAWAPFNTGEPSITQGFLYSGGTYTILPFLGSAGISTGCPESSINPTSINDSGVVFGDITLGAISSPDPPCSQRWQGILPEVPGQSGEFLISFTWFDGQYFSNDLPGILTPFPVPEPGTAALLGGGLVFVWILERRTRRRRSTIC